MVKKQKLDHSEGHNLICNLKYGSNIPVLKAVDRGVKYNETLWEKEGKQGSRRPFNGYTFFKINRTHWLTYNQLEQ